MTPIARVLETILYVDDLDGAARFYTGVLGLQLDSRRPGVFVFLRVGDGVLLLFDPKAAQRNTEIPAHGAVGPGHACFAVAEAELEAWKMRLTAAGIAIEHEQDWPRGGRSIYFAIPPATASNSPPPRSGGSPKVETGPPSRRRQRARACSVRAPGLVIPHRG